MAIRTSPGAIPKDIDPWLYNTLRSIIASNKDGAAGLAAIARGETPDGSGSPLFESQDYLYLPGRPGGQTAFGGVTSGDNLYLNSTASSVKGKIYLGAATAYDDANKFLGIATASPVAHLHLVSSPIEVLGIATVSGRWNPWSLSPPYGPTEYYTGAGTKVSGGANAHATALQSNDGRTSYIAYSSAGGGTNPEELLLSSSILDSLTYIVTCSVFTVGGTLPAGAKIRFRVTSSSGKKYVSADYNLSGLSTTPTTIQTTINTGGTPVSTGQTPNILEIDADPNGTLYIAVSYIKLSLATPDIMRWDSSGGTQKGRISPEGYLGAFTGTDVLSAMLTAGDANDTGTVRLRLKTASTAASPTAQTNNLIECISSDVIPKIWFSVGGNGAVTARAATAAGSNSVFSVLSTTDANLFRVLDTGITEAQIVKITPPASAGQAALVVQGNTSASANLFEISPGTGTNVTFDQKAVMITGRVKSESGTGVTFTDGGASPKQLAISVANITAATTKVWTSQDRDGTVQYINEDYAQYNANTTIPAVKTVVKCYDASPAANITFTMPSAATVGSGRKYTLKNSMAANTLTVAANGAETFDGAATLTVNAAGVARIVSDGTNWLVI